MNQKELRKAICESFGLKRVTSVTIKFSVGQPMTVEATQIVKENDKFFEVLNQFALTEKVELNRKDLTPDENESESKKSV